MIATRADGLQLDTDPSRIDVDRVHQPFPDPDRLMIVAGPAAGPVPARADPGKAHLGPCPPQPGGHRNQGHRDRDRRDHATETGAMEAGATQTRP